MQTIETKNILIPINCTNCNDNFSNLTELLLQNFSDWGPKRDPLYIVIPFTFMFATIFFTGLIGNISTCIVIASNRSMHTATNYYLFSLAMSDLLLLICGLPPEMYYIWSKYPYIFGEAFCVLQGFAAETSANATVLTITAFTVERYIAICYPFLSHTMSKLSRVIKLILVIWLFAVSLAVPQAMSFGIVYENLSDGMPINEDHNMCNVKRVIIPHAFLISTLLFFVTPMSLITVLYILIGLQLRQSPVGPVRGGSIKLNHLVHKKSLIAHTNSTHQTSFLTNDNGEANFQISPQEDVCKTNCPTPSTQPSTQHVIKMLVAVVVAFFICWAPFHAQRLLAIYGQSNSSGMVATLTALTYISGVLYYLSTTINPVLYHIMSHKFRLAFKVWIFGDTWCSVWLALDVWMCTASILNLCAISLDRYVAVTRPITYPSIMSHSRAKLLIAGLWVLSFVICFPPLVGWKDKKNEDDLTNSTLPEDPPCPWKCELTNEAGYVVYSALGSFYIPMFVMLFFYWRIYRAAVRTTRAINQGFRTTKGSKGLGNRFDEQRLTLRIHRGRGSSTKQFHGSPHSTGSNSTTTTTGSPSPSSRGKHERVKISVSYPSTENVSSHSTPHLLTVSPTSPLGQATYAVHYTANGKEVTSSSLYRKESHLRVQNRLGSQDKKPPRRLSFDGHIERMRDPSPSPSAFEDGMHKPKVMSKRMGKRNIKAQVKRFRMETKAAKTLGIIVGGFIFCWLPFFTMYLIRAFCASCIHPLVFSVLFWLGYCNSAINPLIYALFSKDFRFAFKRIICKCFCTGPSQSSRRGSDGSQLAGRHFRSPSYNAAPHGNSIGEESDPGGDPSDSR